MHLLDIPGLANMDRVRRPEKTALQIFWQGYFSSILNSLKEEAYEITFIILSELFTVSNQHNAV